MSWKDLSLEEQIDKCWEQIGKAYATGDFMLLNKYTQILSRSLNKASRAKDELPEIKA